MSDTHEEKKELIDYRLDQIEKKLDTLTDLVLQTQAQEMRLSTVEKGLNDFIKEYRSKCNKNIDRWLTPLVSALISGLVAFVLVKVGIK